MDPKHCKEKFGGWRAIVYKELLENLGIGTRPCKLHQCCKMKERLERHHLSCRGAKALTTRPIPARSATNSVDRSTSVSAISLDRPNHVRQKSEFNSTQTELTFVDDLYSPNDRETSRIGKHKQDKKYRVDKDSNSLHDGIVQMHSEILSRRNMYSDRLNRKILELFNDITVSPDTSDIDKQKRLGIVKKFADKVADLFVYINDEDYNDKIRYEIDRCLRDLSMLKTESQQDTEPKCRLGDSLFKRIKSFNEKWCTFRKETRSLDKNPKRLVYVDDDHTNFLDKNIIDWAESNLQITADYDFVIDTLVRKIKSVLESGINLKHTLKAEIIQILEELSQYMDMPKDKAKYLNELASNLTNSIIIKKDKMHLCGKNNSNPRYGLKNEAKLTEILSDYDIISDNCKDETVNEITDVLFGNIDSVLHEKSLDVVKDIRRILKSSGEFSNTEALSLAKTLVKNVRDCFSEDIDGKIGVSKHSSSFIVLTSEQELSNHNSGSRLHLTPTNHVPKKEISTSIETADNRETSIKLLQVENLTRAHRKNDKDKRLHSYKDIDTDENRNEFITNFIQRNYNIDDDMVEDVLKYMLIQDIYKLSLSTKEELYKNLSHEEFNADKFRFELEIVKEVCSWLKNMPFYNHLLQPGSETIEFLHGLARNITDIETERLSYPNRMDYDSCLQAEIAVYMLQKEEEMSDEDKLKIGHCAEKLCFQIINLRKDNKEGNELTKMITEHMKKYDSLLAKDYIKKTLWHRRLGEELMKMSQENPAASPADAKNRLKLIPIPRDESVLKFKLEIKYNIIINDWLHDFPQSPPKDNEEELKRKNMVKELQQKIIEFDQKRAIDHQADGSLNGYIADWISNLNLDPTVNVDVPMKISQLRSGLVCIKWMQIQPQQLADDQEEEPINSDQKSSKRKSISVKLGEEMVETIEDWCNNLPIEGNDDDATKAEKETVATKIFQVVGSLSDDPRMANDYQKFRDMLGNEIDAQLQILSIHAAVEENKDNLKVALLDKIIGIKNKIRDIAAGDDYMQALERSIDATMYNLCRPTNKNDPGYELFKRRMVMLWLLQNYDYAVDFHSLKYKKMLSEEIHFLSEEGQKRNVFPADKDDMMNDIMSAFYRAQPPDEDSIIDEIENIKLRCEIEVWVKELPLRETSGFKKLLERDQILTLLTKILFDIERSEESDADEKMKVEIMKWVKKLPLLPEEKNNLAGYADLLVCLLKASANSRKCQRQAELKSPVVLQETLNNLKCSDELHGIKETLNAPKENQEDASPVAGPSAPGSRGQDCAMSKEKLGMLITSAINNWCKQLPLTFSNLDEQRAVQKTKEHISQTLMQLVSELHYRPNTLNNEGLYEYYLNNRIENILIQLTKDRFYWEAQRDRNERKYQLINTLKAIRPLVQDEKDRECYKEKLKHTISSFHESMMPYSAVQLSASAQKSILDDFMQYKKHKDFESQELYKLRMNDTLNNEINEQEGHVDSLLAINKLICELSKVKSPKQSNIAVAAKRRFSQPNPQDMDRLSVAPAPRRPSLPYPLPPWSSPRFVSSQNLPRLPGMRCPAPVSENLRPYPIPGQIPVLTPIESIQSLPQQGSVRFPSPGVISRSPLNVEPGSIAIPSSLHHPFPEVRPYPLPPPQFHLTESDTGYQSPRARQQLAEQRNVPPDFVITQPSYEEQRDNFEQLNVPRERFGRGRTRPAERVQNNLRSAECPEEQRRNDRQGRHTWAYRERRGTDGREYCETCDRDRDCALNMPRPYPMPMDYMYD